MPALVPRSLEQPAVRFAHKIGARPHVYSALRHVMNGERYRQNFLDRAIGAEHALGRILDLGCGAGQMATFLPKAERYVGIDENPHYIRYATHHAPPRATFVRGDITLLELKKLGEFDCIIAMGVLHHLSDEAAHNMLHNAAPALSEVGKMATTDCARRDKNHWSANFMINHDRGNFVRDAVGYQELMLAHFSNVQGEEMLDGLRVPLTGAVFPQYITHGSA